MTGLEHFVCYSENFTRGMPTTVQFERTMYRCRREVIPPNPQTQSDIEIDNQLFKLKNETGAQHLSANI